MKNSEIYERFFVNRDHSFEDWLNTYLEKDDPNPFSMPSRSQYDLGDLLLSILPNLHRYEEEQTKKLIRAFKEVLRPLRQNLRLDKLSAIAHAAARSGFAALANEIALTIGGAINTIYASNTIEEEGLGSAIRAIDKTVASIGQLALIADDDEVISVCTRLFEDPELALFSSSLFTPLAVNDLGNWPKYWNQLLHHASQPMISLGLKPEMTGFTMLRQARNGRGYEEKPSYFDAGLVLEDFLREAIAGARRRSLKDIVGAAATSTGNDWRAVQHALALLRYRHVIGFTHDEERLVLFVIPNWMRFSSAANTMSRSKAEFDSDDTDLLRRVFDLISGPPFQQQHQHQRPSLADHKQAVGNGDSPQHNAGLLSGIEPVVKAA